MKAIGSLVLGAALLLTGGCDDGQDINDLDFFDPITLNRIDTALPDGVYRVDSSLVQAQCEGPNATAIQAEQSAFMPDYIDVDASNLNFRFDFEPLDLTTSDAQNYRLQSEFEFEFTEVVDGEITTNQIESINDDGFLISTRFDDGLGTKCTGSVRASWVLVAQNAPELRSSVFGNTQTVTLNRDFTVDARSDQFYRISLVSLVDQLDVEFSGNTSPNALLRTRIYGPNLRLIADGNLSPQDTSLVTDTDITGPNTYYFRITNNSLQDTSLVFFKTESGR